ncbi:MAG TPA: hypothetical protein VG675_00465 [Bryobacteraceae bacterium]|nr:hypothetical protein [Bryobacteraceae bacterium]
MKVAAVTETTHNPLDESHTGELLAGKPPEQFLWEGVGNGPRTCSVPRQSLTRQLYHRELKLDVRSARVLASQTPETALQEVAALVLASAVIARIRVETGTELEVPPQRVSFMKLMSATEELWVACKLLGELLTAEHYQKIWQHYIEELRSWAVLPERRSRSCPRVLRQPVSKWPRKIDQPSHTGKVTLNLVRV